MKTTPGQHLARIKEELEHLVFNEDIPAILIRAILWEVQKTTDEALNSVEDKLSKERKSKNGKEENK